MEYVISLSTSQYSEKAF